MKFKSNRITYTFHPHRRAYITVNSHGVEIGREYLKKTFGRVKQKHTQPVIKKLMLEHVCHCPECGEYYPKVEAVEFASVTVCKYCAEK